MVIDTSAPLSANGAISSTTWTETGFDNGDGQGTFTPYAMCVSSSIAGYSEASKVQSVNAASSAQLTETCPAGSLITGAGFAAGSTAPVINVSDSTFRASGPVYDQSSPSQTVGSDFSATPSSRRCLGWCPTRCTMRLVATNSAGTTFGPDATFTTKTDPPPSPPKLGGSFNAQPVKGLVLVEINGKFVPLTEVREIPNGAIINALHGTLTLITSAGERPGEGLAGRPEQAQQAEGQGHDSEGHVRRRRLQVTQLRPCDAGAGRRRGLRGRPDVRELQGAQRQGDGRGALEEDFAAPTRQRQPRIVPHQGTVYGSVRGTVWSIADRCDGTVTNLARGTAVVRDFVRHKTITVHAGHSYLASAHPLKHK